MKTTSLASKKQLLFFTFTLCTFFGSFLLFQVQPIIGKYMLPYFGGTAATWTTTMCVFQILLLLGYMYTTYIARFKTTIQVYIHATLLTLAVLLIAILLFTGSVPILPRLTILLTASTFPIPQIILFLLVSVGVPYTVLATTSTLMQKWFHAAIPAASPYPLYSLSNAGSLLGLLSYPFLVEPHMSLSEQGIVWSLAFLLVCLLLGTCCYQVYKATKTAKIKTSSPAKQLAVHSISKKDYSSWLLLSATGSIMLLAITNMMTLSIAPVPLLWILPLALYLISFIVTFQNKTTITNTIAAYIFLILLPFSLIWFYTEIPNFYITIGIFSLILFTGTIVCHGTLYRLKPHPALLERFYLMLAAGGALGGIFVSIIAPLVFKGLWELIIGIIITAYFSFSIIIGQQKNTSLIQAIKQGVKTRVVLPLSILLFLMLSLGTIITLIFMPAKKTELISIRNFYGIISVTENRSARDGLYRTFSHGKIIHGRQYFSPEKRKKPVAYYAAESGVSMAITTYRNKVKKPIRVGIVGLGIGTLAAFGEKGDYFRFYEINAAVNDIALEYFTYLKDSAAKIDLQVADGRLGLEQEAQNKQVPYDILILDAFSDDGIPVHLMTKEAVLLYRQRLAPNGVLIFNITNGYFDFTPIMRGLANETKLNVLLIQSAGNEKTHAAGAYWAILSQDKKLLNTPLLKKAASLSSKSSKKSLVWTDNNSNLLQITK